MQSKDLTGSFNKKIKSAPNLLSEASIQEQRKTFSYLMKQRKAQDNRVRALKDLSLRIHDNSNHFKRNVNYYDLNNELTAMLKTTLQRQNEDTSLIGSIYKHAIPHLSNFFGSYISSTFKPMTTFGSFFR